ncbi:hypothetical protein M407DRAFT_68879 [Tulasnella calospora MUT 4182]|uniref:Uncharacterized protein n=1 Tax=Tulasnella calospora MUT 4182 TaxID=1051891 RepID=A0A0C3L9V0_9AGAM|nr:hypothetical protein M407DRAFT_68879 [Tulasnella calospora MUT 4182]
MTNSRGQSPCVVYAYLSSKCSTGDDWKVTRPGNSTYAPPSGDKVNMCQCNTVTYNLMEACGYCQAARIGDWKSWIANCPQSYISTAYPYTVPPETEVPSWAFKNPEETEGSWDPAVARQQAGKSRTMRGECRTVALFLC